MSGVRRGVGTVRTGRIVAILRSAALACGLVLIINGAAGANGSPAAIPLTPDEQAWLAAHPVIRLAPDPEFKPIEYFDGNGTYQGVAADNIKLLEQKLGIRFTVVRAKNWDEVMEKFRSHEVDALGAIVETPGRRAFMRISTPLFNVPGAILVRKNGRHTLTLDSLKGMRVAVVSNYTAHDVIRSRYPDIRLDVVSDTTTGLTRVSFGMVDAFVENLATATYYMQEAAISNVSVAGDTPFTYQWGIGVRSDWPELERIINKGIAAISDDERRTVLNRWLPVQRHWRPGKIFMLSALAGSGIFLSCAVLAWSWTLRRTIAHRTASLRREISERQRAEDEVRTLNATLEQRVAERTAALEAEIEERRRAEQERNKLEEQLRQSQKMEAIGQLAGGVAHDFNNILSAIMGYGQLAMLKLGGDDPLRNHIEQVLLAAQRAASLTQSLLAFSRKQTLHTVLLDLNDLLRGFEKFLLRLVREDIAMQVRCAPEVLLVMADGGQIEQVIMNLVANARDAMPNGGSLTIETRRVVPDEGFVKATGGSGAAGEYAMLSVTDSGVGMDEQTRERMFEPFFTTKELGKGTGLGLSMAYGIISKHDGIIHVYSEPGQGTTVKIYLPLAEGEAGCREAGGIDSLCRGSETVLIAEDDAALRDLTRTVLEECGYAVIDAEDGEDAVRKFLANADVVNLVILDGIMPKMNGKDAFEKMRAFRPGLKAIFASGYAEDIFTKDGVPMAGSSFMQKPMTPTDLLRKIREVLDRAD
jgi:signal transduction histidine kinase/ActR/RegA family two-component response regulator